MNIQLEISDFLALVDLKGLDIMTSDRIERLEYYITSCNKSLVKDSENGDILLEDVLYERLIDIIKKVKPDSDVLELWSEDSIPEEDLALEENKFVKSNPMVSINTIKNLNQADLREFYNALPYQTGEQFSLFYGLKENGHGTCVRYRFGDVSTGRSRGRHTLGRDLTMQFKRILGDHMESLEDLNFCEIRGEIVLPFDNMAEARKHNPKIKTAFTGVSSMLRDSASEEETQLLQFVAYGFYAEGVEFATKEEEYQFLEDLGFTVPMYVVQEGVTKETLVESMSSILDDFSEDIENYEYFTDGLVCSVNDLSVFRDMGLEMPKQRYFLGNVALKAKHWKQDCYSGIVYDIVWTEGKSKWSPVALVTDGVDYDDGEIHGVPTASGNSVRRIPLYEPANILQLEAYIGNVIFFRYGGESGVIPCFPNGTPLVEGFIKKMLEEQEDDMEYLYI